MSEIDVRSPAGGPAAAPSAGDDRSLTELVSSVATDLSTLVRKELELAKVEVKEEASKAGKAGGFLAGGAVFANCALIFVSLAAAWLLDQAINRALAFPIVGVIHAIVAAVLAKIGRDRLQSVSPVPEQTVETLKEDVQWARAQRS